MKMKKLLALLLCLMLVFTLAACGGEPDEAADPDQTSQTGQAGQAATPPKSDYQQAYDKALTAFYLPEGIWQLQLLDEEGNTGTEATVYLRFNRGETETLCTTTLAENSLGRLAGPISHTTTATNTTSTTMRIRGNDEYYADLTLGSIDVGSRPRYNVTYTANLCGAEISVPALLQPMKDSDPLLPVAEYQLATYQLDLGEVRLDNYAPELRGEIWAAVAAGLPVADGVAPQVVFKGYEQLQHGIVHHDEYSLYPAADTNILTWFGFDAEGRLTQDAAAAVCYVYYIDDASAAIVTDYTATPSPLYAVAEGGSITLYGGDASADNSYSLLPFSRVMLEGELLSNTDQLDKLQAAAKVPVDAAHYYVLLQAYIGGTPDYTHLGVAEVENGRVVNIYDPLTGSFFYEN